jgi:hypothetical protein
MRKAFTISISSDEPAYSELTHLFRTDFAGIGRQGTFDDVVADNDPAVLSVPYWAWLHRVDEIRERLAMHAKDDFPFVWPLIRDSFPLCHALISGRDFSITPVFPMVDMFPTFANCPARLYMSATVADDSSIIQTFDASVESVSNPIFPTSLAGVGERMILAPELMIVPRKDLDEIVGTSATWVSQNFGGVVILTPSIAATERWDDVATVAHGDDVAECVATLLDTSSRGPYAFPNRYDGIDLPGESCRLLVLDGLPKGTSSYELYRAASLEGSSVINASIAQRVEQGMGRGTRGGGDHSVVLLTGKDLVAWASRKANIALLTPSTRAQLSVGLDISRSIGSARELADTMSKCLNRSPDWVEYHAEVIADAAGPTEPNLMNLSIAECERRIFRLARDGYYEKGIAVAQKLIEADHNVSSQAKGWILQMAAWVSSLWKNEAKAGELQQRAFGYNRALFRPRTAPAYAPMATTSEQSESILEFVTSYSPRSGACTYYEEIADWLTPNVSSNQFEESIRRLGEVIGFRAERPDRDFGIGPDVLWVMPQKRAWIIEAKSQKKPTNPLTKGEHGQLLEAFEWFRQEYPEVDGLKVVIHPNTKSTESVSAHDTFALTLDSLLRLIPNVRQLLSDLAGMSADESVLASKCEQRLRELNLTPDGLTSFLAPFESA